MGLETYQPLLEGLRDALKQKTRSAALYLAMRRGRDGRTRALQEIQDFAAFRANVRRIKERSIANLDELVKGFAAQTKNRGAHVFMADTANDAIDYILGVVKRSDGHMIAKSKSLTSEEIGVNEPLEHAGYRVVETDLGERIIQIAGEKPFHLVFPAIHKTSLEVAELFSKELGTTVSQDLGDIMKHVRSSLREVFLSADVGITGANVAIAESGTVVIETNEGNARLVAGIPRTHIVIVGVEKIVETFEEALPLIRGHAVSATGQRITTYVSMVTGRSPLGENRDRELHIVILDNGRARMKDDPWFREALYCIRCGACMNICAPYSISGGHLFGHVYPGPIGIPWTSNVHGLDKAKFAHLCISCGLCKEICPADIDIPLMIARVKELDVKENGQLLSNRVLENYEAIAPVASNLAPAWNWFMRRRWTRMLVEKLVGIDQTRPIPEFRRQTFARWYRRRKQKPSGSDSPRVALFVDFFANYVKPEIAITLVEILEAAGVSVVFPEQKASGYPFIGYGDLEKAKRIAEANVGKLYSYVKQGYDIVSIEPTATSCLKHYYPILLGQSKESMAVSSATFEALEYLSTLMQQGRLELAEKLSGKAGFHVSCHQRSLSAGEHATKMLKTAGLEIEVRETGMCCGMAGTFGLKKGPLGCELASSIGEPLFDLFKKGGFDYIVTESSVCRLHLQEGTGLKVLHPLELLGEAAKS